MQYLRSLLGLIRFSHTIFALPFALTSATLAWYRTRQFDFLQLLGILLCLVFARSAAMAFNRLVDRHYDAHNPRTAGRHLPAGQLRPLHVWIFFGICAAGFLLSTLLFLVQGNPWPSYLGLPVLVFLCVYSYTKRFTTLAHFWLGISLLLAPLAAWIAIRGIPSLGDLAVPGVLGLAVLFWVAGFDIFYACQDVEFDRKARLRSIPAALGIANSLRVAALCHLLMWGFLLLLYFVALDLQFIYLAGVLGIGGLLLYEHSLVRADDLSRVNQAFFQVNGVISLGMFVIVLLQLSLSV